MSWELILTIVGMAAGFILWAVKIVFQLGRIAQALEQALTYQAETLQAHGETIETHGKEIANIKPRLERVERISGGGNFLTGTP